MSLSGNLSLSHFKSLHSFCLLFLLLGLDQVVLDLKRTQATSDKQLSWRGTCGAVWGGAIS